jgi:hypothetical protein
MHNSITVSSFPSDDRVYRVKRYGYIRKNPSPAASTSLVEVEIEDNDTGKLQSIEIALVHLFIVKIGTLWQNQKLLDGEYDKKKDGFSYQEQKRFYLHRSLLRPTQYLVRNKSTRKKRMVPKEEIDIDQDEILSVFTVFYIRKKDITVLIPCIELFVSTYVPETHYMLHDLTSICIDQLIKLYVTDYKKINDENGLCTYKMNYKRDYRESTKVFLAYLACNQQTRRHVSKLRSSMQNNQLSNGEIVYSYIEALPYHPEKFNITVSGLYDEKKKRFWVFQITGYDAPSDCVISYDEYKGKDKNTEQDLGIRYQNEEEIIDGLDLIDDVDPGVTAGVKYVKSNVSVYIDRNKIKKETKPKKSTRSKESIPGTEVEAVSAGPQSGQGESKPVGVIKVKDENSKKENHLKLLIDAIRSINAKTYFLVDDGSRKSKVVFCTLPKKKTYEGRRSNWAIIPKKRPRKLLVCELCLSGKFVYIIDIERKHKDTYAGVIFSMNTRMDMDLLKRIKDAVSINQGRFGGNIKRKKFPVDGYKSFRHFSDPRKMKSSIYFLLKQV